jgi:hypothetical protein
MPDSDYRALCAELVVIEDAMSGGSVQLSSQGQALDGYAALAAFRYIAAKARIALAQPEPVALTDDNLRGIFYRFCDRGDNGPPWIESEEFIQAARAVLACYGTPANEPVPVSERLPGPDDRDAEGRCWWHRYTPTKEWHLQRLRIGQYNHWLPHWALPTPGNNTRGTQYDGSGATSNHHN